MKKIVITMRSFKKFISQDLLQLALIISLLKVDPDNYLGLQPGPGQEGGGGVILGSPPPLAGWPHHFPHLAGKQVDSLLERYQEEILEDLNNLGRFSRLSLYGGVPVQLSAYLVDTEVDIHLPGDGGTDSDSGISDTDRSPPSPPRCDEEEACIFEDFDLQSLLTPPPEDVETVLGTESWSGAETAEVSELGAGAEQSAFTEDMFFEELSDDGDLVFGPEIPPELAEAGIPEIEDHGAIQLELMHMEEQLMHLDYDIEEINAASMYMDEKIAFTISEEEPEVAEDMDAEDISVLDELSLFGPAAGPFDDWEREAFADISDLLTTPEDSSTAMMAVDPQVMYTPPVIHTVETAVAATDVYSTSAVEDPATIQDFDLNLLGSPKPDLAQSESELLLQELLELDGSDDSSSSSALRNDVMLTMGQFDAGQPPAAEQLGAGYMPESESLHRSYSREEDGLLENVPSAGVVKEDEDLIAQVLKESAIFDAEIDLESSGIKMEIKEEDIKQEVKEEEEVLLDQVVEVVPCPGYELDADGACAQLSEDMLLEAVEDKGLIQFTLSRGMALAYNPSFNAAAFNNDHSSYVTNSRGALKSEPGYSATSATSAAAAFRRRNESESSSGYSSDENRPSRDEKLACKAGLPFTARQLVDCSVEAFNEYISRPGLSKEQVKLCKDIRRRGKNKVAAQNCRRRKLETIEELQSQVESVRMRRAALLQEREQLETQRRRWSGKLEMMEQRVLAGLGKNIAEFTLQVEATRVRVTARLTTEAVRATGAARGQTDGRSRR